MNAELWAQCGEAVRWSAWLGIVESDGTLILWSWLMSLAALFVSFVALYAAKPKGKP